MKRRRGRGRCVGSEPCAPSAGFPCSLAREFLPFGGQLFEVEPIGVVLADVPENLAPGAIEDHQSRVMDGSAVEFVAMRDSEGPGEGGPGIPVEGGVLGQIPGPLADFLGGIRFDEDLAQTRKSACVFKECLGVALTDRAFCFEQEMKRQEGSPGLAPLEGGHAVENAGKFEIRGWRGGGGDGQGCRSERDHGQGEDQGVKGLAAAEFHRRWLRKGARVGVLGRSMTAKP
jgi:hypothetical protein